jgi:glutamyl/glutaminyl-tRNA synthetase
MTFIHQTTFTSDSFKKCEELAVQIIKDGLAYMDDTPQEAMQVRSYILTSQPLLSF